MSGCHTCRRGTVGTRWLEPRDVAPRPKSHGTGLEQQSKEAVRLELGIPALWLAWPPGVRTAGWKVRQDMAGEVGLDGSARPREVTAGGEGSREGSKGGRGADLPCLTCLSLCAHSLPTSSVTATTATKSWTSGMPRQERAFCPHLWGGQPGSDCSGPEAGSADALGFQAVP